MGKIRTIRENDLGHAINGQYKHSNDKIYPVTTSEAVSVPNLGKLTPHVHPRIILSEAEMEQLIEDVAAGRESFKDGYDYLTYEED